MGRRGIPTGGREPVSVVQLVVNVVMASTGETDGRHGWPAGTIGRHCNAGSTGQPLAAEGEEDGRREPQDL